MKKYLLIIFAVLLIGAAAFSDLPRRLRRLIVTTDLVVGQSGTPDASAALEIESSTKGFLPPRVTTTERDNISSPAEGLVVYNETTEVLNFRNSSAWAISGDQAASSFSDWATCTVTGTWTTNTTYTCKSRRVGDTEEYVILVETSGAPDTASLRVDLISGRTIDTAKLVTTSNAPVLGYLEILESGVQRVPGFVRYFDTNTVDAVWFQDNIGSSSNPIIEVILNQANPHTWGAGDQVILKFSVPISGWSF